MTSPTENELNLGLDLKPGDRIRMTVIVELTLEDVNKIEPARPATLYGLEWVAQFDDQASILVTDCKKL